ncbi:MAG TPA: hypothetical protein VGO31_12685 [Microbacteriaceae bacterium]|jgi:hypothetical protein|nr:hypothetical protein [Microbacteriaceae bacterium]
MCSDIGLANFRAAPPQDTAYDRLEVTPTGAQLARSTGPKSRRGTSPSLHGFFDCTYSSSDGSRSCPSHASMMAYFPKNLPLANAAMDSDSGLMLR